MYNKILLAMDGSENSKMALQHAAKIAEGSKEATIEIVYVVNLNEMKITALHTLSQQSLNEAREERKRELESLLKDVNVPHKITILLGDTGSAIADYANENQFDLVVIGQRGKNPMQAFVLGSVSHYVAKRANCPVLIVK